MISIPRCAWRMHGQIGSSFVSSLIRRRFPFKHHRGLIVGSQRISYHELVFTKTSSVDEDVSNSLQYRSSSSFPPRPVTSERDWVLVELHAAPWNPADLNTVQGKYPGPTHDLAYLRHPTESTPPQRNEGVTVAGSEGLGKVVDISSPLVLGGDISLDRERLRPGDWVVLGLPGLGSYRSHLWLPSRALLKLNYFEEEGLDKFQWSTLLQLGGTAWRLLLDFSELNHSQHFCLIQNAGLSNVSYMVRQLLQVTRSQSTLINVIRQKNDKPKPEPTVLGNHSTFYFTEQELDAGRNTREMWDFIQNEVGKKIQSPLVRPILGLDSVAGKSGSRLVQILGPGGKLVNYGALSKQPISVSAPHLIFEDKKVLGYWHSRWMEKANVETKQKMLDALARIVMEGKVVLPPVRTVPLHNFRPALLDEHLDKHENENISIDLPSQRKLVFDLSQNKL